jgi:hypothetical protein
MKYVKGALARVVRTTLSIALALPVFAAQPAVAAVLTPTFGFETGANPRYMANDHSAARFNINSDSLEDATLYSVDFRMLKDGVSSANDRGFIWNPTTGLWVAFDAPVSEMPTFTGDSPVETFAVKFGDERASGSYTPQARLFSWDGPVASVVVTATGTPADTITVFDLKTEGAKIHRAGGTGNDLEATVHAGATLVARTRTANDNYSMAVPTTSAAGAMVANYDGGTASDPFSIPTSTPDVDIALGAADMVAPAAPESVVATPSKTSIGLTWKAVTGASGYRVYRWTDAPAGAKYTPEPTLVGSPATTAYTDSTAVGTTEYSYEVRAVDASTNVSARSATVRSKLDTTAPTATATNVGNANKAQFSIVATDGALGSGVKSIKWSIETTGVMTTATQTVNAATALTSAITTPGAHKLHYVLEDAAGNTATPTPVAFTVTTDTVAPVVTATVNGNNTPSVTVNLVATDAGRGMAGLQYRIVPPNTNTTITVAGTAGDASFATTTAPVTVPGTYTLSYVASDVVGLAVSGTTTFTVVSSDTAAPVTTISTIPAGWTNQSVTVTFTAFDASSTIAGTYYRLNGGATSTYSTATPVVISAEGTTTIEYWSVDNEWPANKEATKTATIRIDKTLPTVAFTGDGTSTSTMTVSVDASDALSGLALFRVRIDGGAWTTATAPVTTTFSTPGTHTVEVEATDAAGNVRTATASAVIMASSSVSRAFTPGTVTYGNFLTVSGVLSSSDLTAAVEGLRVRVFYYSGGMWKPSSVTAVTDATGAYSLRFRPSTNRWFQVRYEGGGALLASRSANFRVLVRPVVKLNTVATQRSGRTFSVYATLAPAHRSVVSFKVYRKVGTSYRLYRTVNTTSIKNFRARFNLPAGTYRIRASHKDAFHAFGASPYRYFRVR